MPTFRAVLKADFKSYITKTLGFIIVTSSPSYAETEAEGLLRHAESVDKPPEDQHWRLDAVRFLSKS